jgi:SOS-response transcriptional repressor LexA
MDHEQARKAVRVWMRDVMRSKGWTAAEWARRAGTTSTNITRVLSPTSTIIPSAATLALLASAAGSQPQLAGLANMQPTAITVPLLSTKEVEAIGSRDIWAKMGYAAAATRTIQIDRAPEGPAFAVEVSDNSMEGRGIFEGDRLLIEKLLGSLEAGAIVLFETGRKVRVGEWNNTFVTFRPPPSEAANPEMLPVPARDVHVIGQAISLIRDLV